MSASLHAKNVLLWALHERVSALEQRIRPNPAVTAPDPYELAAHWRDKCGEAMNRAERAEAAASQAIDERDVWVRDCKSAEARAEKVERHDKAMSEEVVRLRKELDQAELARDRARELLQWCVATAKDHQAIPEEITDPQCVVAHALSQYKRQRDASQAAADTLERLKDGLVQHVGGGLKKLVCPGYASELEAERDNWKKYHAHAIQEREQVRAERYALAAKVAELERVPRGTIAGEHWIGVPSSELADLRRDAQRWRWMKSHAEWRRRHCCGQMEWTVATPDNGNLNEDVDAAISAEVKHDD